VDARQDEHLWYSSHKPFVLKSFSLNWSSPDEVWLVIMTRITPLVIVRAKKIATRKMSIFLDRWYMACSRMIMITWKHGLVQSIPYCAWVTHRRVWHLPRNLPMTPLGKRWCLKNKGY
jgi:hypothetical protein